MKRLVLILLLLAFPLLTARPVIAADKCWDITEWNVGWVTIPVCLNDYNLPIISYEPCYDSTNKLAKCCTSIQACMDSGLHPKPVFNTEDNRCYFVTDTAAHDDCVACFDGNPPGAWTAIGCIQTDPTAFFSTLLSFGIGIAGGIAFLLILLGGFQVMTSTGNPEQLTAGKELVTSAITGLILIIFSVFLLRIIGVNILGLPGFAAPP